MARPPPFHRSAGACPPRSFDLRGNRPPTNAVFLSIEARRGTGPRPTVNGTFFHRSAGALACHTRRREGFPRDRSTCAKNARKPTPFLQSRHGEGQALALRYAARFLTVGRGPVPRDRTTRAKNARRPRPFPSRSRRGRDRPSPYGDDAIILLIMIILKILLKSCSILLKSCAKQKSL